MKLVTAKPQRLHCPQCQDTYSLPQSKEGALRVYGEQKCPLDEFELVYWYGGAKTKVIFTFYFLFFFYFWPQKKKRKEN
jgi:DNA topoisomerase-3